MKAIIISFMTAIMLLTATAATAATECASSGISRASPAGGQYRKFYSFYAVRGWHNEIVSVLPGWITTSRTARDGFDDVIDLSGVPQAGIWEVVVRYTRPDKSITCTSRLQIGGY